VNRKIRGIRLMLVMLAFLFSSLYISRSTAVTGPVFQSATFFGGAGDQRGSAITIDGADLYIAAIPSPRQSTGCS
jgi:hypothetical protein